MTLFDIYYDHMGMQLNRPAATRGGEWKGPCPICGGDDRFRIQPNQVGDRCVGFYACRGSERGEGCALKNGKITHGDTISFGIDIMGLSVDEAYQRANATPKERPRFKTMKKPSSALVALKPPTRQWQYKAPAFTGWAHAEILKRPEVLKALESRGLPEAAVKKYRLGWCPEHYPERFNDRAEWGLDPIVLDTGELKKLWFPIGFVIPTMERNGDVIRLKIRNSEWTPDSVMHKYHVVQGSMNGLNIIGNTANKLMVVVESELDAYAVEFACSDFAFAVAIGGLGKNLDKVTDFLAKKKQILICYDNDGEKGLSLYHKWHEMYPKASKYPTPVGKDIGEFIQQGYNVRKWLLEAVPDMNLT